MSIYFTLRAIVVPPMFKLFPEKFVAYFLVLDKVGGAPWIGFDKIVWNNFEQLRWPVGWKAGIACNKKYREIQVEQGAAVIYNLIIALSFVI